MFIPIGDEDKTVRRPFVNYAIIALNSVLFLALAFRPDYHEIVREYGTVPSRLSVLNILTSAFLHGGPFHIIGNMLFLWVFGDNIEDRIGHILYVFFYLGGALSAGLVYALAHPGSDIPAIGASGAISAVLGAYMVMLPRVKVRIFYFVYYRAGTFALSAVYVIGFWVFMQVFYYFQLEAAGFGGTGYSAHLGGLGFGIAMGFVGAYVLKSLRRDAMERIDKWHHERAGVSHSLASRPDSRYTARALQKQREFEARPDRRRGPRPITHNYVADAQANILDLLEQGETDRALEEYLALVRKFKFAVLPVIEQLRIADLFLTREEYRAAREAYERFLRRYPQNTHADDVRYNLAMLCAECVQDYGAARRLLKELVRKSDNPAKRAEYEEELKRVEEHFAKVYTQTEREPDGESSEQFAIFRQSTGQVNISEVGRVIATMLKVPLADVTTRLFTCTGFLADHLQKSQAEILARDLQKMNIPVFLLEQEKVRQLPEAVIVDSAAFGAEGFSSLIEQQSETFPWDSILMVNAGVIESSRTREVPVSSDPEAGRRSAYGFGPRRRKTELIQDIQERTVIDVLLRDPWERFRIQEGFTHYSMLGDKILPTARENLQLLAQEVVRHADTTFVGDAVSALASRASMSSFVYDNRRKYDLTNFWLAHRALFDRLV